MRLNKFIAFATGVSRRAADSAIERREVQVNKKTATLGVAIDPDKDTVIWQGKILQLPADKTTIILNKPAGYVCSRNGQGSKTVYDLLPEHYQHLKLVGRLDKDSSGLLLLTDDGDLAYKLTHPQFQKEKIYEVMLDDSLSEDSEHAISVQGVVLKDGLSQLSLHARNTERTKWLVKMSEGRNRQIRRTFEAVDRKVIRLHRTHFGPYALTNIKPGSFYTLQYEQPLS